MKTRRKEKNAYLHMLLRIGAGMLAGACIGFLSASWLDPEGLMERAAGVQAALVEHTNLVLGILALLLVLMGAAGHLRQRSFLRRLELLEDEEADLLEARIDAWYAWTATAEGILYLLAFLVFAVWAAAEQEGGLETVGIFAGTVLLYPLFYILHINLTKKYDPAKKGVPGTLRFQKEWLKSCDEAERLQIYRAAYKSNRAAALILTLGFGITVLLAMFLPIGTAPIYIVGLLWMLQVITSGFYAAQSRKKKERKER